MITLEWIYVLAGLTFAAFAWLSLRDAANPKRLKTAAFWGLLAASFLFGSHLSSLANGLIVAGLSLLAGVGGLGQGKPETTEPEAREALALKHGNRLFAPALVIPIAALAGTLLLNDLKIAGRPLVDAKDPTLIWLGLGVAGAVALAAIWLKPPPARAPAGGPAADGRRRLGRDPAADAGLAGRGLRPGRGGRRHRRAGHRLPTARRPTGGG